MKPAPFSYHRPNGLDEALLLLDRHAADARLLAGGQSLGPMLNMRLARPAHLIDLNDLIELDYVRDLGEWVEIGALTRQHRIATAAEVRRTLPLLSAAAATIGHYAIRQRGTLAGSLVHADPAAQIPLVAATLDAEIVIRSSSVGERVVPARDFLQSIMSVDLKDTEMVVAARFPKLRQGTGFGFELFSRRHGDFAIVAVAVEVSTSDPGAVTSLRLGIGGVDTVPVRMSELETAAVGRTLDREARKSLAQRAAALVSPEDSRQVPAVFRRELVATLTERALAAAAKIPRSAP